MAIESKPDENPEFALLDQNDPVTGEANVAEPPTAKKNYGWAYLEKPGHNWMNWLHRKTSEWLTYFNQFFSATHQFKINEIVEYDDAAGVTIDGSLIKDGDIKVDTITEKTADAGVTIDGSLIKDGDIKVDTITEKTADAGVTIEGVELKDNDITVQDTNINQYGIGVNGAVADAANALDVTGDAAISGGIATGGNSTKLAWKVIEIGDWDMDATEIVSIPHGFSGDDWKKIRFMTAIIRIDMDTAYSALWALEALAAEDISQSIYINSTNIVLTRDTDGLFDGTNYNSTSFNRGWITIAYEV